MVCINALKCATITLFAFDYLSVTVNSVRYMKHCVDGQPTEHAFVADIGVVLFSRSMEQLTRAIVNDFGHFSLLYAVQCGWM